MEKCEKRNKLYIPNVLICQAKNEKKYRKKNQIVNN